MRSLSRPMFNMGGPIKQGIMHGIREPYKGGGKAALVGNPIYPKTGGREHHFAVSGTIGGIAAINAARHAAMRYGARYLPRIWQGAKNIFGKTSPGKTKQVYTGYSEYGPATYKTVTEAGKFTPNWLGRDPIVQGLNWGRKSIFNPTTGGLAAKALRFATAPSSLAIGGLYYANGRWFNKKGEEVDAPTPGTGVPGGGDPGMTYTAPDKEIKVLSDDERKAFALKQRSERVQKYLDLMGYDRSKKTAIADALIDASKIVGDRGTLDPKNITQELINPIIQATSKRLDKPDQIREAVGLMATKAEIEKDLNKETKDLDRRYKKAQIKAAEAGLEATESFEGGMKAFISARKGTVDKTTLERIARLLANEHEETFTKVTEDTDITTLDNGIYMSEGKIIRMTDGVPTQIV